MSNVIRRMYTNPAVFNIPNNLPTDATVEIQFFSRPYKKWIDDGIISGSRCDIEIAIEQRIRTNRLAGNYDLDVSSYRAVLIKSCEMKVT